MADFFVEMTVLTSSTLYPFGMPFYRRKKQPFIIQSCFELVKISIFAILTMFSPCLRFSGSFSVELWSLQLTEWLTLDAGMGSHTVIKPRCQQAWMQANYKIDYLNMFENNWYGDCLLSLKVVCPFSGRITLQARDENAPEHNVKITRKRKSEVCSIS